MAWATGVKCGLHAYQDNLATSDWLVHACAFFAAMPQQERAIKGEWKCVDDTLDFVHKTGFNVLRIWAFNDGEGDGKLQATRGVHL
jgi:hypothetical protein